MRASGEAAWPYAGRIARWLVLAVCLSIPLIIVGYGYLPPDDALRHAAKAVTGRPWSEIVVLRPGVTLDSHPGWHAVLRALHLSLGLDAHALVLVQLVVTIFCFSLPAALTLSRPEAWLIAWSTLAITDPAILSRMVNGRPLWLTAALWTWVCLSWDRLAEPKTPWRRLGVLASLVALAAWLFPSWYLWAYPVLAFALLGQRRVALRLAGCVAIGVFLAGCLVGNPVSFTAQSLLHPWLVFSGPGGEATLAIELRPYPGSPTFLLAVGLALVWRVVDGGGRPGPLFGVALAGWALGLASVRFWSDWGMPAMLVWLAREIERSLEAHAPLARQRMAGVAAACLVCSLAVGADVGGRWSHRGDPAPALLATPQAAWALPDPGGILYTDEMPLFFQLFYRLPEARFRYMVGYEPGLMPADDRAVYRRILAAKTGEAFAPWVRKMRPPDRLLTRSVEGPPPVPGLVWQRVSGAFWSGRLAAPAAP